MMRDLAIAFFLDPAFLIASALAAQSALKDSASSSSSSPKRSSSSTSSFFFVSTFLASTFALAFLGAGRSAPFLLAAGHLYITASVNLPTKANQA
jgi:hypothetical protein